MDRGQAEALLPQIRTVLAEAGLGFADLGAVATTVGPGSFTGLRIGLAAAHGLALATNLPILAPTSFAAHREGIDPAGRGDRRVVVAIDSKRGPVFVQTFDTDGHPEASPSALDPIAAESWIGDGPLMLAGDAGPLLLPYLTKRSDVEPASADRIQPLGLARAAHGLPATALPLPLYLREPDVTRPKARVS
jgi:tRNA threonylcarbamoyladenosine biosynthesis protein TsaB